MSLFGTVVKLGIGAAIGASLKGDTRQKVRDAADALQHEVTGRLKAEGARIKKFWKEEVLAERPPEGQPVPVPASSGPNGPPASA